MRTLLALLILLAASVAAPAQRVDPVALEAAFQAWLQATLWPDAERNGISRRTFDAAFAGVTLDLGLPELLLPGAAPDGPAIDQAEFRSPAAYFREDYLATAVRAGRGLLGEWRDTLAAVERQFGVPGPVVLAVWSRETVYGAVDLPEDGIRALATHAFTGRRPDHFRPELIAALVMIERGDIDRSAIRSSWAGALGQPQLLPSSYLRFAVDFDRDGDRDVWGSVPDILATIANVLAQSGWQASEPWGVETSLPAPEFCAMEGPTRGATNAEWRSLGFAVPGALGPDRATRFLLAPAGTLGPAFLVSQNFYVVKEYNFSDLYALYVLHLADRIAGAEGSFATGWAAIEALDHGEIQRMQRQLEALGYDVGGADGLVGFRTRVAIGAYQRSAGLPVTCFPNAAVFRSLG